MAERQTKPNRPGQPQPGHFIPISYQFNLTNTIALQATGQVTYPNDPFRQAIESLRTPNHFITTHTDSLEVRILRNKGLLRAIQTGAILLLFSYFYFALHYLSPAVGLSGNSTFYSMAGVEPASQPNEPANPKMLVPLVTNVATDKHLTVAETKHTEKRTTTIRETGSSPVKATVMATPEPKPVIVAERPPVMESKPVEQFQAPVTFRAVESSPMLEEIVMAEQPVSQQPIESFVAEGPVIKETLAVAEKIEEVKVKEEVKETPAAVAEVLINEMPESKLIIESLETIKQLAREDEKLFFLKFGAKWCLPCRVMEETTFQDKTLKKYISDNYHSLKVDVDDFDGYNLKQIYQVKALPSILVFNSEGKVLARYEESMSATQLMEQLSLHNQPQNRKVNKAPTLMAVSEQVDLEKIQLNLKEVLSAKRMMK